MRVNVILGHDWDGPKDYWLRKPFLDGGRLKFNRHHKPDWQNVYDELGRLAGVPSLLHGIRGYWDTPAIESLHLAAQVHREYNQPPTVGAWFDTGGLSDCVDNPGPGNPYDFGNAQHINWGWERYGKLFFVAFPKGTNYTLTTKASDARILCAWWGIGTSMGHGMKNLHLAQNLLNKVSEEAFKLTGRHVSHIVDKGWLDHNKGLQCYGAHGWFDPWGNVKPPEHVTVYKHNNGITTGMVVPSFVNPGENRWRIHHNDGGTLDTGLRTCAIALCDEVLLEGGTDFEEGASPMRDERGDDRILIALKRYANTVPITPPIDPPVDPPPQPLPGGIMKLAVSDKPILKWKTGVLVESSLSTKEKKRYAVRWNQKAGSTKLEDGFIDPTSQKFLCLNPDGSTEAKDNIGEWESSQPVKEGAEKISWFTESAGGEQAACLVFGLQQFAE